MLFGKKNCKHCGSSYDVAEDTCPACHQPNEDFDRLGLSRNVVWLPYLKQVLLFAIGYLGLDLIALLVQLFLGSFFEEPDATYFTILNTVRYTGIFAVMIIIITPYMKKFLVTFKKLIPYLIGILGAMGLIGFAIIYGNIINLIYPTETSDNQQIANEMISAYPILCLLVLGIVGPIVEEITYRVGVFTFFLRINKWAAYLVTAVIFAFIHFNFFAGTAEGYINELLNLPSYLFAGLFLCFLYHKFGLASSVTAHILNNLYSVVMMIILNAIK